MICAFCEAVATWECPCGKAICPAHASFLSATSYYEVPIAWYCPDCTMRIKADATTRYEARRRRQSAPQPSPAQLIPPEAREEARAKVAAVDAVRAALVAAKQQGRAVMQCPACEGACQWSDGHSIILTCSVCKGFGEVVL